MNHNIKKYLFLLIMLLISLFVVAFLFMQSIHITHEESVEIHTHYHLSSINIASNAMELDLEILSTYKFKKNIHVLKQNHFRFQNLFQLNDKLNSLVKIQNRFSNPEFNYLINAISKLTKVISTPVFITLEIHKQVSILEELKIKLIQLRKLHIIESKNFLKFERKEREAEGYEIFALMSGLLLIGGVGIYFIYQRVLSIYTQLEKLKLQAEGANKAKSEFLSTMSHELRTPLNLINGMLSVLSVSNMDKVDIHLLDILKGSTKSMIYLVNDILDLSKIEAQQVEIEDKNFDLNKELTDLLEQFHILADKKDLELIFDIDEDVLIKRKGDAFRIRQVLYNLIGNACKFTSKGFISLRVRLVKKGENNLLRFKVQDSGIGIPKDKIKDIFEKFSQADSSVTRKYGGTGLGLNIAREVLNAMGSKLHVRSKEGLGSEFFFDLNLELTDQTSISSTNFTKKNEHKKYFNKKILLVDDCADNRLLVKMYLQKLNCNVTEAEDGEQAIGKFSEETYDLVFMDMQMPVLDGYETTRILRSLEEQEHLDHTPIIAISADVFRNTVDRCIELGCDYHLKKPLDKNEFLNVVHEYFEKAS